MLVLNVWQKYEQKWADTSVWITDSPSIKAKKYLNTLHEFGVFYTYPPFFTERSGLDLYLLVITLDGEGFLLYGGEQYSLRKGTVFFIHCIQYQKYWTAEKDTWDFIWVHVNGQMVKSYFELMEENSVVVLEVKKYEHLAHNLRSLKPFLRRHQFYFEVEISQTIQFVLNELLKLTLFEPSNTTCIPTYVQELQHILTNDFTQKWTLDALANRLSINKYQMAKQFTKHIGISPNEFLIVQRINYAKYQLRNSTNTVYEIAHEVGVENVSHFIELFKKREGVTPLAYRHICLDNP